MAEPKLPSFFKAIWVTRCSQSLEIPISYVKHIKVETAQSVYLKGPSGDTWDVELVRRDGRLYFEEGWPEFFKFHSLRDMYFLIFKYDGKMNFKVKIVDDKSLVKRVKVGPKFSQGLNHPKKSGTMEKNAATPPLHVSEVAKLPLQDHAEVSESGAAKSRADHSSFVVPMKSYNVSKHYILQSVPPWFITKHFSGNEDKLEVLLENEEGDKWPVILLVKKHSLSGGWAEFVRANYIEEGDTCTFKFVQGLKLLVHISRQRDHSRLKRQHIQGVAEVSGDKKKRHRVDDKKHYISEGAQNEARAPSHHHTKQAGGEQRVGDSDAKDLTSFPVRIKDYNKSFINVDREFFKAHCSSYRKKETITLENEEGGLWSVTMCRQGKSACLSAGWALFAQDNLIQANDICTFKLVSDRKMHVHISSHCAPS